MEDLYEKWRKETKKVYSQYRNISHSYMVTVLNKEFVVLPHVFSPKYYANTTYFADRVPKIVGKRSVLEIGTGTGVIAIFCALNGAQVTATDINHSAVENCHINAEKHEVAMNIREGSLFEPIKVEEKFDFIFWNHPWNYTDEPEEDVLLKAGFDYKYEWLHQFFKGAKNHLLPGGKILLGTGGFARLDLMEQWAKEEGYMGTIIDKQTHTLAVDGTKTTDFIIYQFEQTT